MDGTICKAARDRLADLVCRTIRQRAFGGVHGIPFNAAFSTGGAIFKLPACGINHPAGVKHDGRGWSDDLGCVYSLTYNNDLPGFDHRTNDSLFYSNLRRFFSMVVFVDEVSLASCSS